MDIIDFVISHPILTLIPVLTMVYLARAIRNSMTIIMMPSEFAGMAKGLARARPIGAQRRQT
jgi:hypothetical protein